MAAIVVRESTAHDGDSAASALCAARLDKRELCISSYVALCIAVSAGLSYHPAVLAVLLLSFALLCLALSNRGSVRLSRFLLENGLFSLPLLALIRLPMDQDLPHYVAGYLGFALLAFFAGTLFYSSDEKRRRQIVYLLGGGKLLLLILGVYLVRRPLIDVWQLQQLAVDYLLQGQNPYTTAVPDIYRGGSALGHQVYYSYAPLNLLLSIPAKALLGDYRYGLIASLCAALLLFRKTGRQLGVSAAQIDFLTLLLILHPRLERLVIYGWLEPYMILLLSLAIYLWATGRGGLLATALVLVLPLLKQYVAAPLLLYVVIMRPRLRSLMLAGGLALVAVAPLLVWNFDATIRNGLLFFVNSIGFRTDAMSASVPIYLLTGYQVGVKTSLAAQVGMGLLAVWLLPSRLPSLARFVLASAAALFASFLLAPQAFLNYYFFISVLIVWAALLLSPSQNELVDSQPEPFFGPLRRAALVLFCTGSIAIFANVLYYHVLCPRRASVGMARLGRGLPLLEDGPFLARTTEQIWICEDRHCFGPLCHDELRCLCAEKESFQTPHIVEAELFRLGHRDARCVIDHAQPLPTDRDGKCQRARCHERLSAVQSE